MQFETNTKWKIKFLRLTTGTLIGIWTNWLLANNFSQNIFQLSTQYNQKSQFISCLQLNYSIHLSGFYREKVTNFMCSFFGKPQTCLC